MQYQANWDQEEHVSAVSELMQRLDPAAQPVLDVINNYIDGNPNFPELTAIHESITFEVTVIQFESGEINEDEFKGELKEFDDNNPMFEVELHLMMQTCLKHEKLREKFEEEFNDYIPGIEHIESADYAKFVQLCNTFVASLVKELIPHNK